MSQPLRSIQRIRTNPPIGSKLMSRLHPDFGHSLTGSFVPPMTAASPYSPPPSPVLFVMKLCPTDINSPISVGYHARPALGAKILTALRSERVLSVHHWTDSQFTFVTSRDSGLRFENGQFVMVGMHVNSGPLLRAYSIASANHEEHLEFLSIKVPGGPLTSRLQHVRAGDQVLVSRKPTGTLLLDDLRPGRRLYLLSTGTGAAPFVALIKDPQVYERFEHVIFVQGVRRTRESAFVRKRIQEVKEHEYFGQLAREKLSYYATATREPYAVGGRITSLIESERLFRDLRLPNLDPAVDRVMVCGNPAMLKDTCALLDSHGFNSSPSIGHAGDYVVERAFVNHQ
jgi:ferredoxin--NADP+ reductase